MKSHPRIAAPSGGVRKADRTLLVTSTGNVPGNRRQSLAVQETAVTQPAVRGVLNGAIARSRELRRQVRQYLCFNKCAPLPHLVIFVNHTILIQL